MDPELIEIYHFWNKQLTIDIHPMDKSTHVQACKTMPTQHKSANSALKFWWCGQKFDVGRDEKQYCLCLTFKIWHVFFLGNCIANLPLRGCANVEESHDVDVEGNIYLLWSKNSLFSYHKYWWGNCSQNLAKLLLSSVGCYSNCNKVKFESSIWLVCNGWWDLYVEPCLWGHRNGPFSRVCYLESAVDWQLEVS